MKFQFVKKRHAFFCYEIGKKVLLVSNDDWNREKLMDVLQSLDYNPLFAGYISHHILVELSEGPGPFYIKF